MPAAFQLVHLGRTADEFARRLVAVEGALDARLIRALRFHLGLGAPPTV